MPFYLVLSACLSARSVLIVAVGDVGKERKRWFIVCGVVVWLKKCGNVHSGEGCIKVGRFLALLIYLAW